MATTTLGGENMSNRREPRSNTTDWSNADPDALEALSHAAAKLAHNVSTLGDSIDVDEVTRALPGTDIPEAMAEVKAALEARALETGERYREVAAIASLSAARRRMRDVEEAGGEHDGRDQSRHD